MKFIVAFVALVAVAVALPVKPIANELAELEAVLAAINSPNTDPATAVLLEEQLAAIIAELSPVSVGPAIVETSPIIPVGPVVEETSPVSIAPILIDFPLPDGGAVTAEEPTVSPIAVTEPVQPSPVVIGEIPAGATPLVQIIVNVNQPESGTVAPAPVVAPEAVQPGPVNVVEGVDSVITAPIVEEIHLPGPVNVVEGVDSVITAPIVEEILLPGPVNVVDAVDGAVPVEPVLVVNPVVIDPVVIGSPELPTPVVVEPVIVATPIIPAPAVVIPDILN